MDITKLATLARIKLSPEEAESLSKEFDSILKYVDQIKSVHLKRHNTDEEPLNPLMNVMRNDDEANPNGANKETLLSLTPQREGDYIKVKKIL